MPARSTNTSILAILAFAALGSVPPLAAQQVSSHTLIMAVYQGQQTAGDVLASLRKRQHAAGERLESYAVVSRNLDGKLTVQQRPTVPSPAIEVMLGTLGEPARESAAAADAVRPALVDSLEASLPPGSSAVIAFMDDRWAEQFQQDLKSARARAVMASIITQEVEEGTP